MIKIKYLVTLLLFVSCAGFAQRPDNSLSPLERADRTTQIMKEKLGLNEDQVFALDAVNKDFFGERKERPNFREMSSEERESFREEMREKNKNYESSIQAILTEEQFLLWGKLQEDRRAEQMERRGSQRNK